MSTMLWQMAYDRAKALGCRTSVLTRTGHCLALANWDDTAIEHPEALIGTRWHEFVEASDLPALLAWCTRDGDGEPILYRGLGNHRGRPCTMHVCLVKFWAGSAWVAVGDAFPARRPSPTLMPWPAQQADQAR